MDEPADLAGRLARSRQSEAAWKERCARLQEQLEEAGAERTLLEAEIRQKRAEAEQARDRALRAAEEVERRVRERTAELEAACGEMRKLDELKDSFLSSVSHELRTPLTSIRSFSEILLSYADVDPDTRQEFLRIINLESERLTRLINDVLDLSKIESGNMIWHDDLVSIGQVLRDAVKAQAPEFRKKGLSLKMDLPEDLPPVFSDRDRVHQVATNLLGNAVKFSPPGGEIRVRAERAWSRGLEDGTECIRVTVSDQGRGIRAEDQKLIFERFRQASADTLNDKPDGTGLGLPICREIVAHYKGEMGVRSEPGNGSDFFFLLPVSPLCGADPVSVRPEDAVPGWKGKTILVVDDNRNVRRVLRYQFQKRGYTVLEATCGPEAIALTRSAHIDLITLDLMMPAMSGYDVLKMIRENPVTRDIPILIISVVEDRERGLLLGANDCLGKPFSEEDLIRKVCNLMGEEKRSILVVDDEPSVQEVLRMRLGEMGFPVEVAGDGDAAIDSMKRRVPDLLILDVLLPGKNGHEVLNWVRNESRTAGLPVIMISACPLSEDGVRLLDLRADAFVEKSGSLASLLERIDAMVTEPVRGAGVAGGGAAGGASAC